MVKGAFLTENPTPVTLVNRSDAIEGEIMTNRLSSPPSQTNDIAAGAGYFLMPERILQKNRQTRRYSL